MADPRSNIVIYPYKQSSESAIAIKKAIEALKFERHPRVLMVRSDGTYEPRRNDVVFGWGAGDTPQFQRGHMNLYLNQAEAIRNSINKITSFRNFNNAGVVTPEWTTVGSIAQEWLNNGHIVLSRMTVDGAGGKGIKINHPEVTDQVQLAPLYVKFYRRTRELRVHVYGADILYSQEKRLKPGVKLNIKNMILKAEGDNWNFIWNPPLTEQEVTFAVAAIAANGLDFGAVDMIDTQSGPLVLETNTCPELGSDGARMYARAFIREAA